MGPAQWLNQFGATCRTERDGVSSGITAGYRAGLRSASRRYDGFIDYRLDYAGRLDCTKRKREATKAWSAYVALAAGFSPVPW